MKTDTSSAQMLSYKVNFFRSNYKPHEIYSMSKTIDYGSWKCTIFVSTRRLQWCQWQRYGFFHGDYLRFRWQNNHVGELATMMFFSMKRIGHQYFKLNIKITKLSISFRLSQNKLTVTLRDYQTPYYFQFAKFWQFYFRFPCISSKDEELNFRGGLSGYFRDPRMFCEKLPARTGDC